jgi:hypothetical protein
MKISSTVHPQPGKFQYLVLDVLVGDKPFFAAILIGDTRSHPPTTTVASNECLRRLVAAQDAKTNSERVHIVEIRDSSTAPERVALVASKVERHDAVAFFCIDEACYKSVLVALNPSS